MQNQMKFILISIFVTSLSTLAFAGENVNTTIQEGRVNTNDSSQVGKYNDNATYQKGSDNANRSRQRGDYNVNQTGQFGDGYNYNESDQRGRRREHGRN